MTQEIVELIERRRRQILVHSCIYYRMNDSIIDDLIYDEWSKELAELQEKYPEEAQQAPFHEYFKDYDGSSGFDLPIHLPEVVSKATQVLRYAKSKERGR